MENRIIKFRAWIIKEKKMSSDAFAMSPDGSFWQYADQGYYVNNMNAEESHKQYLREKNIPIEDEFVLMQFTGLKDKNGVEIYEGDLLRYPGDPIHFTAYEVFFHDGDANSDFNIGYSCYRTHHQGSICGGPIPSFKPKSVAQMEICGNIFQHPELLSPHKP